MNGTRQGKRTATRRRWFGMGGMLVGAAMCAGVAFAVAPEPVGAQTGTIRTAPIGETGTIIRTGGVVVGTNVTAVATYVIVAPGGLVLGVDLTPIADVTPVTYVNGVISGPASGPAPVQTISTPTVVPDRLAAARAGGAGGIPPGQYIIGSVDGPVNGGVPGLPPPVTSAGPFVTMPAPVQTISTPTFVSGVAPPAFSVNGPTTAPPFVMTISTPTSVSGVAPAAFSASGATTAPPFVMTISTPTAVNAPASFAGAARVAGGTNTENLVGTPGGMGAVVGISYPGRGGTP